MDIPDALDFVRRNGRAVLATVRRDGRPQLSPVLVVVDYYRRAAGEHADGDDYRAAMERERRVALRITPRRAGPSVSG